MRTTLLIALILSAASGFAERQPYERYATIADRQMFGEPPPGFDPSKMPNEVAKTSSREEKELTQEQEQVKKAIRFSVINVNSAGETVVGFSDNGDPKNPLHYYLKVGESQNGWTVKEADSQTATMTVEKDGIEVSLKLGGDSGGGATAKGNDSRVGANLLSNQMSFRERRRREQQQLQVDAAKMAEEAKAREAREEEEKKQREAERAEQREQLLRIQEELRKAREARESQKQAAGEESVDE